MKAELIYKDKVFLVIETDAVPRKGERLEIADRPTLDKIGWAGKQSAVLDVDFVWWVLVHGEMIATVHLI